MAVRSQQPTLQMRIEPNHVGRKTNKEDKKCIENVKNVEVKT